MSLTIPGSIVRCILLLRQEAGSPLPELTLACVEPVKVVCLPLLSICELSAFSDIGVTVLSSHPEKSCSPQDVISLLLFTCDVPEHINIHLPFYCSSLADSLATPGLMLFRNVSSWDPGNIFVFSFLPHLPFSLVLGPFE